MFRNTCSSRIPGIRLLQPQATSAKTAVGQRMTWVGGEESVA
jgi:hypothetical protein